MWERSKRHEETGSVFLHIVLFNTWRNTERDVLSWRFQPKSSAATFVIPPGIQDQSGVPTRLLILHLKIYTFSEFVFLLLSLLRKSVYYFPGNRTHNLCAAKEMLYHWATGTLMLSLLHYNTEFWFQWLGDGYLHSMLHFTFALKKDFTEMWFITILYVLKKYIICTCDHTIMIR